MAEMAFHRHKLNNSNFRGEASYSDERLQTYCLYDNSFTSRPGKSILVWLAVHVVNIQ